MGAITCTTETSTYLEAVTEGLLYGQIQLYDLPSAVAGLYYLGEASLQKQLQQVQAEADRYYRAAARGSFAVPIQPQGKSFADLCRLRGDHALADRVEADLKHLRFQIGGAL